MQRIEAAAQRGNNVVAAAVHAAHRVAGQAHARIEEAAARTQARIDSGAQTIVGTNKYRLEPEDPIDILEVDNSAVRQEQAEGLAQLRANRDNEKVKKTLAALTECVRTGEGNLLEKAVECAKARATLGEIPVNELPL